MLRPPLPVRPCPLARAFLAWLVPLALAAAAPGPVPPAQSYTWRNVAVQGGGLVTGLVYHPAQRGLLYARTDVGGAFRWDPAAAQWLALNDDLDRAHAEWLGALSLAVDARDPRRLYLACGSYLPSWAKPGALLASSDQGATWTTHLLPCRLGGNADGRSAGERLQVDPRCGNILFLGSSQDGLWRSEDHGQTWRRVPGFPATHLTFVLIDPRGGTDGRPSNHLYAGSADLSGPALYRSDDAGRTWRPVPGQPAGLLVQHAALAANGALYSTWANHLGPNNATRGAVWKLDTDGDRWTELTPVRPDPAARDLFGYAGLTLDVQHPGTLLVSTLDRWTMGDEIFRSRDDGKTWRPLLATSTWDHAGAAYIQVMKPHWIGAVALDPFDSEHAMFVTGYGVWATRRVSAGDAGAPTHWSFANHGMEETVVTELASPPAGAHLLCTFADIGGFRIDDPAAAPIPFLPLHGSNSGLGFAALQPGKLVRAHSGPARGALSLDGGTTWRDFHATPEPATKNGSGVIAISADGRRLVWQPKGAAPFVSSDDGASWTPSRADFVSPTNYLLVGPVPDGVNPAKFYFYDPTSGRVHVSANGGTSFALTGKIPSGGGKPRPEPGQEGRVWIPTPKGLFLSVDSGSTFTPVDSVQAAYQVGFGRAAPGRVSPALYLSGRVSSVTGLFRSDDDGATWTTLNDPAHQFGWCNAITGDARVYGRVYVGTGGRGIIWGEPTAAAGRDR